jgi:hypothetical protein
MTGPVEAPQKEKNKIVVPYYDICGLFRDYWKTYGGWIALFTSPYLHFAALAAANIIYFSPAYALWDTTLSIVPSMLGFSLAGYAIIMAIGAGQFQEFVARAGGREHSVMGRISAAYIHFMTVQVLALSAAVLAQALHEPVSSWWHSKFAAQNSFGLVSNGVPLFIRFVGNSCAIYPVTAALAATFHVFLLIQIFVEYAHRLKEKQIRDSAVAEKTS